MVLMMTGLAAFAQADHPFQRCFQLASLQHNVPVDLLIGVASVESNFNPSARSDADAHGIMQIRWPLTAKHLGVTRLAHLYNPCVNIDVGASYLSELLHRFGEPELALAAYNYGPSRIKTRADIPPVVWRYVARVMARKPTQIPIKSSSRRVLNSFARHHRARAFAAAINDLAPDVRTVIVERENRYSVEVDQPTPTSQSPGINQLIELIQLEETYP